MAAARVSDCACYYGFETPRHVLCVPSAAIRDSWMDLRPFHECLVPLEEGDDEYAEVARLLLESLREAHVTAVCRVEQPELRADFERACELVKRRARRSGSVDGNGGQSSGGGVDGGAANVLRLWHGCGRVDPVVIMSDYYGFDPRLSNEGMWGRAAYFARDAKYSDRYAHVLSTGQEDSEATRGRSVRQLFFVDVAVGRAESRNSGERINRPSPGFDSVTGWIGATQVYMVYEVNRAYPTHLVTYEDGGR